jgi:hypothetical protein
MLTEGNASLRALSYAETIKDPLPREAVEIDGFEETRHKQVLYRWSVGVVGVDQHAAEGPLVPLAAENNRPSIAGLPYPGSAVGGPNHRVIQGEPPF